jgi:hypothetical protein
MRSARGWRAQGGPAPRSPPDGVSILVEEGQRVAWGERPVTPSRAQRGGVSLGAAAPVRVLVVERRADTALVFVRVKHEPLSAFLPHRLGVEDAAVAFRDLAEALAEARLRLEDVRLKVLPPRGNQA